MYSILANSSGQVSTVQSSGLASRVGDRFANDEVVVVILTLVLDGQAMRIGMTLVVQVRQQST